MASPAALPPASSSTDPPLKRSRSRSKTVSTLDDWRAISVAATTRHNNTGAFAAQADWADAASEAGSGSASGSDSAYGTLEDELDSPARWRKPRVAGRRVRKRSPRSRSVGDAWLPLHDGSDGSRDADSSDDSFSSSTGPTTAASSRRSSPEPSECDFELCFPGPLSPTPSALSTPLVFQTNPVFLSRRHTIPRRKHVRGPSISFAVKPTLGSPPASVEELAENTDPRRPWNPISIGAGVVTVGLSLAAHHLPAQLSLLPASPVHLLHPESHLLLHCTNALLSSFLVTPSMSSIALGVANLASLNALENDETPGHLPAKAAVLAGLWSAVVGVRVLLSWVFGRVLGWAHPTFFSTTAVHQVGSGLGPLLVTLCILRAFRDPSHAPGPLSLPVAILAANFTTPVSQGGTGLWWGISGVVVGLGVCLALVVHHAWSRTFGAHLASAPAASRDGSASRSRRLALIVGLAALPFLTAYSAPPPSLDLDAAFASLHPQQRHLVTVLLMTAPRPGEPDFLFRTIESWLGALPDPPSSLTTSPIVSFSNTTTPLPFADPSTRLRVIVYTHFRTHAVFDAARTFFTTSPQYASKAAQYLEWHRDPRGVANRLDQRLHVARGLAYASSHGGESAYVLLTEDDFPLCPGPGSSGFQGAWDALRKAFIETNQAMPDEDLDLFGGGRSLYDDQEASSGHCGLFVATGGSGLALRGFVAARLPALLLGSDDADGSARDARAARGEFSIKHEDEGADTPDLVIQDCLRGRIPGCETCAPGAGSRGGARRPGGVRGERWGKSGLASTERLMQHHLGYNASTLPGRKYGKDEWACGWRQPFNGEPDVLVV